MYVWARRGCTTIAWSCKPSLFLLHCTDAINVVCHHNHFSGCLDNFQISRFVVLALKRVIVALVPICTYYNIVKGIPAEDLGQIKYKCFPRALRVCAPASVCLRVCTYKRNMCLKWKVKPGVQYPVHVTRPSSFISNYSWLEERGRKHFKWAKQKRLRRSVSF